MEDLSGVLCPLFAHLPGWESARSSERRGLRPHRSNDVLPILGFAPRDLEAPLIVVVRICLTPSACSRLPKCTDQSAVLGRSRYLRPFVWPGTRRHHHLGDEATRMSVHLRDRGDTDRLGSRRRWDRPLTNVALDFGDEPPPAFGTLGDCLPPRVALQPWALRTERFQRSRRASGYLLSRWGTRSA